MVKVASFDVIVIGAGGAGCTAAINAARTGATVALVSKEAIGSGNTRMSEGGMASSGVLTEDSPEVLKMDMIKGGEFLNNVELVDEISKNASGAIRFVESTGHFFLRDKKGMLSAEAAKKFGGHSFPRSFLSPASGVSIAKALRNKVVSTPSILTFEDTLVISLFREEDQVLGALVVDLKTSNFMVLEGKVTILATGGCGMLYYPQTTNTHSATGDGYAVAFETGAKLVDMEMVQFFPFAMNHPRRFAGSLLGEPILAGPKGKLMNGLGQVIADCNINRMTRAQVTALMAGEIAAGRVTEWGGLKLDLSANLDIPEMIDYKKVNDERNRFEKVRMAYGEDAFNWKQPWHVSPSAHYMMGGVKIDNCGCTSLRNLFAVGEVAGGAMGANRLGTTSLTDIFVMGIVAGEEAGRVAISSKRQEIKKHLVAEGVKKVETLLGKTGNERPIRFKRELQEIMKESVGIVRSEKSLDLALLEIDRISEQAQRNISTSKIRRYNTEFIDAVELKNMLTCAKLITHSALLRKESRGAHLRLDYPNKDDNDWLKNITIWKEDGQLKTSVSEIYAMEIYKKMKDGNPV